MATNIPIKISQLQSIPSAAVSSDDYVPVVDNSSGKTYKMTLGNIIDLTNAGTSASYSSTASYYNGSVVSSSYSSTSSYSLHSGDAIISGNTYTITSSWSNNSISANNAITASYALNVLNVFPPGSTIPTTSSWSTNAISASYF